MVPPTVRTVPSPRATNGHAYFEERASRKSATYADAKPTCLDTIVWYFTLYGLLVAPQLPRTKRGPSPWQVQGLEWCIARVFRHPRLSVTRQGAVVCDPQRSGDRDAGS